MISDNPSYSTDIYTKQIVTVGHVIIIIEVW